MSASGTEWTLGKANVRYKREADSRHEFFYDER